jgi:hypothetical protein
MMTGMALRRAAGPGAGVTVAQGTESGGHGGRAAAAQNAGRRW